MGLCKLQLEIKKRDFDPNLRRGCFQNSLKRQACPEAIRSKTRLQKALLPSTKACGRLQRALGTLGSRAHPPFMPASIAKANDPASWRNKNLPGFCNRGRRRVTASRMQGACAGSCKTKPGGITPRGGSNDTDRGLSAFTLRGWKGADP